MRTLGLPGAAIAAVAIPFVIAVVREEEEPPTPEPRAATLTVRLDGPEGGKEPAHVYLTASGRPPNNRAEFRLVDATGLHSRTRRSYPPGRAEPNRMLRLVMALRSAAQESRERWIRRLGAWS